MRRGTSRNRPLTERCRAPLVSALAATIFGLALACGSPPPGDEGTRREVTASGGSVLSLLDYFASGEVRALARLGQTPSWTDAARRAREATVRIRVVFDQRREGQRVDHGSGVLVGDGRHVLTAGHLLASALGNRDAQIFVLTSRGERIEASLLLSAYDVFGQGASDWGFLELPTAPDVPALALETSRAKPGDLVAVFGFPGRIGRAPEGATRYDSATDSVPLLPLTLVAELGEPSQPGRLALKPVAGAIPVGGISGGPVIDARGALAGIQVSVSEIPRGDGSVEHRIDGMAARDLLQKLERSTGE